MAAAWAAVFAAAGCAGTPTVGPPPAGPPPAGSPPAGADAAASPRYAQLVARLAPVAGDPAAAAPALDAGRQYLRYFESAVKAPGNDLPAALDEVVSVPVRDNLEKQLGLMRKAGIVARGHADTRLQSLGTSGARHVLLNCAPNGQLVVYHADSSRPAENPATGFAVTVLVVQPDGGRWRVREATTFTETACPDGWDTGAGYRR